MYINSLNDRISLNYSAAKDFKAGADVDVVLMETKKILKLNRISIFYKDYKKELIGAGVGVAIGVRAIFFPLPIAEGSNAPADVNLTANPTLPIEIVVPDPHSPMDQVRRVSRADLQEVSLVSDRSQTINPKVHKVQINGHEFVIKPAKIKKTTRFYVYGDNLGIRSTDVHEVHGKISEQNNHLFIENLEKFMRESEMIEGSIDKIQVIAREIKKGGSFSYNQKIEAFHFFDTETQRVATFDKETKVFIGLWEINDPQAVNVFLRNKSVICIEFSRG